MSKTMIQSSPNYYSTYLKGVLRQSNNPLAADPSFINERAEAASTEFEERRRDGLPVPSAQEYAMKVLLDGLDVD